MIKERKYGLDLLRIMAMIGVIVLHIVGHGEALHSVTYGTAKYWMLWFLEICFYCSVDVFAMLTGYLCCQKSKFNSYRLFEILAIIFFYSVISTVVIYFIKPDFITNSYDVIYSLIPGLFEKYWYVTAYIPVLIISPFINKMINSIDTKKNKILVFILLFLIAFMPSILRKDLFAVKEGYSFLWILICYILGAYLKKTKDKRLKNGYYFILYFAAVFALLIGNIFIYKIKGENCKYLITYTSPLVVLMAVSVFRIFENIKLEKCGSAIKKVLIILSSVAFDVYIIHTHPMIFKLIFKGNFGFISDFNIMLIPFIVMACVFAIYLSCSLIGIIRLKFFELIGLPKLFNKITKDKLSYSLEKN